jgi:leucyl aminopeptidase
MRGWLYRCIAVAGSSLAMSACAGLGDQSNEQQSDTAWIAVPTSSRAVVEAVLGARARAERLPGANAGTTDPVELVAVPRSALGAIAGALHEKNLHCGGFVTFASRAEALRASAASAVLAAPRAAPPSYVLDNAKVAKTLLGLVDQAQILSTIQGLAAYPTRYYTSSTGKQAAEWLRDRWQGYIGNRTDAHVELWAHSDWQQPSVILTIQGGVAPQEVVVVGGHLDSINMWGGGDAPGADDDASGVATLGEVARVALTSGYRPNRTIKFMAYAAEEVGLLGSREIADNFQQNSIQVVGALQLDMTNFKGSDGDVYVVQDHTDADQNQFIFDLLQAYLPNLTSGKIECGYACSDHASWDRDGYRASIPFEAKMEEYNENIHTSGDTLEVSANNAAHAIKFARLTATYVAELAKGSL